MSTLCGKAARTVLSGGCFVRGIPTGMWHAAGTLADNGFSQNTMFSAQIAIGQALLNRVSIANGDLLVVGKDNKIYWGAGLSLPVFTGPGGFTRIEVFSPSSILGYGGMGSTLSSVIVAAAAGTTAVTSSGEITNRSELDAVLGVELGDPTRNLPGRVPVQSDGNTLYVTPECASVSGAVKAGVQLETNPNWVNERTGQCVTSWKRVGNSSADPTRLEDLGVVGSTVFWGFRYGAWMK